MFCEFHKNIIAYDNRRFCQCNPCSAAINLSLKVITHYGEFTGYIVKHFNKLIGKDIIVAHQLLKNDIEQFGSFKRICNVGQTRTHSDFNDFYGLKGEQFKENFEGIGQMNTIVFYPDKELYEISSEKLAKKSYSLIDRLTWKSILTRNTALDWS
ncbi:MAG: DUF2652 domain-containing protein [Bacteroidota bacterium]|nr:DUF2652 domain-containing protein [Bacteroidota bacterium]